CRVSASITSTSAPAALAGENSGAVTTRVGAPQPASWTPVSSAPGKTSATIRNVIMDPPPGLRGGPDGLPFCAVSVPCVSPWRHLLVWGAALPASHFVPLAYHVCAPGATARR